MTAYQLTSEGKKVMTSRHVYGHTYSDLSFIRKSRSFFGTHINLKNFVKKQLKVSDKTNWLIKVTTTKGTYYFNKQGF